MNPEIPYILAMSEAKRPRPVVLCILDGCGERDDPNDNAIALARAPEWDQPTPETSAHRVTDRPAAVDRDFGPGRGPGL